MNKTKERLSKRQFISLLTDDLIRTYRAYVASMFLKHNVSLEHFNKFIYNTKIIDFLLETENEIYEYSQRNANDGH